METKLEGSRCGSGKLLDEFRQARMLVGTVVMVGRREAGDRRRLCPPHPPGWNMVLPPQGRWTVLGLQSGLAPEWRLRCQEGTHILRGAHLCADMFPDPCPCTYVSPAGSQPRLLHAHRHSDPHSCTRRLTFIESQAPRTLQAVHHRAFAAWRMRFESCFPYRLVV